MYARQPVKITSVSPLEGKEGTVVTLRGSGFAKHFRNNCVVIGGMGACARVQPNGSDREIKARIGPVARTNVGDILMWPGVGVDLHTESVQVGKTRLDFSEVAVFRNGAPQANAKVKFKLTEASPNTFAGEFVETSEALDERFGFEGGAMTVRLPPGFSPCRFKSVDVCIVLKEPTVAIDFTARVEGGDDEECLNALAKTITGHAAMVGEKVAVYVGGGGQGGHELVVAKPYMSRSMMTLHFG
jgi:hypothetical protein